MTKHLLNLFYLFVTLPFLLVSQKVDLVVQTGHSSAISKVIFSPNESFVLSLGEDQKIIVWDIKLGRQYNSVIEQVEEISDIIFINDSVIAASCISGKIKLWNIHSSEMIREFTFRNPIGCLAKASNDLIYFGSHTLGCINLTTGNVTKYDIQSRDVFTSIKINKEGSQVLIGGKQQSVYYLLQVVPGPKPEFSVRRTFSGTVSDLFFDEENGNLFASTVSGKVLSIVPSKGESGGATSDFPTNSFNGVVVNSENIFVASNKSGLIVYNKKNFEKKFSINDHNGKVSSVAISKDGSLLATAGSDRSIILWDALKLRFIKKLNGKVERINKIAFSSNGQNLIIGYANGSFRKSNLLSGESKAGALEPSKVSKSLGWGYSVAQIKPRKNSEDEFDIKFYQMHLAKNEKGEVYDQVQELFSVWNLNDSKKMTLTRERKSNKNISSYIERLKQGDVPPPEDLYTDSLLFCQSKLLGIEVAAQRNSFTIKDLNSGSVNMINCNHIDRISSVAINEKYGFIATAGWDGIIKFWDLKSGQFIMNYGAFGSNDFIFIDDKNNYYVSKGSLGYISFRFANRAFPFDQFDLKFNRPDIVLNKLPFGSKDVVENFRKAYEKRLSKLNLKEEDLEISDKLPVVKLQLPDKLESKDGTFNFSISASDQLSDLDNLCVFVNGVPEGSRAGIKLNGKEVQQNISINLSPGTNYIQVFVNNSKGISSLKESFTVLNNNSSVTPELYLVLMGVSEYNESQYNLKYAQKDANDLGGFLNKDKLFKKVNIKYLLNKDVTIENVKALADFLKPAKPQDVVLFFLAGHGVLDQKLDYYLASSDMDFNNPSVRGINYELMESVIENTKSRNRILFIDACHSGEVDKDEVKVSKEQVQIEGEIAFRSAGTNITNIEKINSFELAKSVFVDFRANNGAWVISSAGATEYAMEGGKWNNGVFTYSLLTGLASKRADLNGDKKIMLSELKDFLIREVQQITNGKQKPNVRNENLSNDIRIQ
ncbi:MAG: caspase family protein [Bacteroidota bacterium]|jgi:WD40 repeat protein